MNMQNLENLDVFEFLITQKLLECPKDPFVRFALNYIFVGRLINFVKLNANYVHTLYAKFLIH